MSMENNKRPREDDEFDDSKRQHQDPMVELIANVTKDIRRIGESAQVNTTVDDISYISNPIVVEFEKIDEFRSAVLKTLEAVVLEQPMKVQVLSLLVIICNAKNFLVSKYVIEYFHSKIQDFLNSIGNVMDVDSNKDRVYCFNDVKNILKFLCCLSPIIEDGAIKNVLIQFLKLSIDLKHDHPSLSSEIYYNTLLILPYVLANNQEFEDYNEILELAKTYDCQIEIKSIYTHFDSRLDNLEVPDIYTNLVATIATSLNFEHAKTLFVDYRSLMDPIITESLEKNKISQTMVKHPLPQFAINSELIKNYTLQGIDKLWITPRTYFSIYNHNQSFETTPNKQNFANFFFKDIIIDMVHNLEFNKNETAVQLSIFDLYFNPDLFAPPGTSFDRLGDINNDNLSGENTPALSTWKIEDVVVETILDLIFHYNPLDLSIYYYTVLIACCRNNPEWFAPVFGRAFRFFFKHLTVLSYYTRSKFMDWMATQISNFDFSWKWDEWVDESKRLSSVNYHPTKNFIKNLISKEVKLSNKKRIKESFITLNPETEDLIHFEEFNQYLDLNLLTDDSKFIIDFDTELFGNNSVVKELIAKLVYELKDSKTITTSPQNEILYIFKNTDVPFYPVFENFYKFLLGHNKSNEQFYQAYQELNNEINDETIDKTKFIITYIFQTYCHIGSRSVYSSVGVLNRDLVKLKWLTGKEINEKEYRETDEFRFPEQNFSDEDKLSIQNFIIDGIYRLWIHQPQFIFVILEHLVKVKLIEPSLIFDKCFSMDYNFVTNNITCFESLLRILEIESVPVKSIISQTLIKIISNITEIYQSLNVETLTIDEVSEDLETNDKVDKQWLAFDYLSLFKLLVAKYDFALDIESIDIKLPDQIKNELINCLNQVN